MFIKDHAGHKVSIRKKCSNYRYQNLLPALLTKLKVAKLQNSGFLFVNLPCIFQLPDQTLLSRKDINIYALTWLFVSSTCDFL